MKFLTDLGIFRRLLLRLQLSDWLWRFIRFDPVEPNSVISPPSCISPLFAEIVFHNNRRIWVVWQMSNLTNSLTRAKILRKSSFLKKFEVQDFSLSHDRAQKKFIPSSERCHLCSWEVRSTVCTLDRDVLSRPLNFQA